MQHNATHHVPSSTHPYTHDPIYPTPKKNNNWFAIIALVLFGGLTASYIAIQSNQDTRSKAQVTGPVLTINPATQTLSVGQTFNLNLMLTTNDDTVSATELVLSYDPEAVSITNFTTGSILPVVLKQPTFENGIISVILGAQPTSPFQGAASMGTITGTVISAKSSIINYTLDTKLAALYKNTNALAQASGATISVPGGGNPSPQAPTVTNTPMPGLSPTTVVTLPTATRIPLPTSILEIPTSIPSPIESFPTEIIEPTSVPEDTNTNVPPLKNENPRRYEVLMKWIRERWINLFKRVFPRFTNSSPAKVDDGSGRPGNGEQK